MSFIGITYLHLTAALGVTAVSSEHPLTTSPIVGILEFVAIFGILELLISAPPGPYKYALFALFCALIGQALAPAVKRAEAKGILREVLASVAGIFIAMSIVGFADNQNFLKFGGYLCAALLGLIIARFALIIMDLADPNSMDFTKTNTILNWVATILFAVFVAYDTQLLKKKQKKPYDYVNASIGLFLDIINLFAAQTD